MNQLNGNEEFTLNGNSMGFTVQDYWRWAYSDMLNNISRGVMAEFLVYSSFNFASPLSEPRRDWLPYDLISPAGRRIEVKSAAYLQSWEQDHMSDILFDIAPRHAWHPETGYAPEAKRNSDLYVFCLYKAVSRSQSIFDLNLWDFYVLPTSVLDRERPDQKRISPSSLQLLDPIRTDFSGLRDAIETIEL